MRPIWYKDRWIAETASGVRDAGRASDRSTKAGVGVGIHRLSARDTAGSGTPGQRLGGCPVARRGVFPREGGAVELGHRYGGRSGGRFDHAARTEGPDALGRRAAAAATAAGLCSRWTDATGTAWKPCATPTSESSRNERRRPIVPVLAATEEGRPGAAAVKARDYEIIMSAR